MTSPNPVRLKQRACPVCQQSDGLLRCSSCLVTYYCGRVHQASDRHAHRRECVAIKKARTQLERREEELRDASGDMFTPDNVFETGVGHFWNINATRPYMRARYQMVDEMLQRFGSVGGCIDAVQTALDHLLDMLRLCRGDNMGVRDVVPALYIRLGKDQAAYDFVKWYATTGERSDYNWSDMNSPFLDTQNADVFEAPLRAWASTGWFKLSHSVAVTLIKVRVLLDLRAIYDAVGTLRDTAPQERIGIARRQFVGTIVESRLEILASDAEKMSRLIRTIESQLEAVYRSTDQYNPHFWPFMFNDSAAAAADRPVTYSAGSLEEAHLMLGYHYAAWTETPGAIDAIRAISQTA